MQREVEKLNKKIEKLEKSLVRHEKLEREIKDSEERFRVLFEEAPDGYFLSDTKGVFLDGNKTAERLIGYKKNELIGKSMLKMKLVPIDQIPVVVKRLAQHVLKKNTSPGEFILLRKDGVRISVEITGKVVKMKGKSLVLGIVRDISDRKKTEKELRAKNQELEKINKLAIGRELKMIELKKKIQELEQKNSSKLI